MTMTQTLVDARPLDFGSLLDAPRARGEAAATAALEKAERVASFDTEGCAAFMVRHLHLVDKMPGEDLTDLAKAHGFRPGEDRAFGGVYARLVRKNLIRCVGYCERRKGNGTAGGRVWSAVR